MRTAAIILFAIFLLGTIAKAETLSCTSKGVEYIYYTEGVISLKADVASETKLGAIELEVATTNLGSTTDGVTLGKPSSRYLKFNLASDAWCNYRISLPRDFKSRNKKFPLWLDARCEENSNSSHTLGCTILP